jgi:hypothetical protein
MEMTVFWDVAPSSLVGTGRRFIDAFIALMMEAVSTSGNVCQFLPEYTAQHSRRQPSSVGIRVEKPK